MPVYYENLMCFISYSYNITLFCLRGFLSFNTHTLMSRTGSKNNIQPTSTSEQLTLYTLRVFNELKLRQLSAVSQSAR